MLSSAYDSLTTLWCHDLQAFHRNLSCFRHIGSTSLASNAQQTIVQIDHTTLITLAPLSQARKRWRRLHQFWQSAAAPPKSTRDFEFHIAGKAFLFYFRIFLQTCIGFV